MGLRNRKLKIHGIHPIHDCTEITVKTRKHFLLENPISKMTGLKIILNTWVSKVIDVSCLIFLRDETVSSSLLSAITRD